MDAFGGGFIVTSLLTLWFASKFQTDLATLSQIFSVAQIIAAISIVLAPLIAKRIGLLNTMVSTHLLSNLFVIFVPFMPTLLSAVIIWFCRQTTSQMDVPTRQSYTNAIIPPEDRASAGAITNTARTIAQSISPYLSAELIAGSLLSLPFIFGGATKIAYDLAIYFNFRHIKPPEETRPRNN